MTIKNTYRAVSKHNRATSKEELLWFLASPYIYSPMFKYSSARKYTTYIGFCLFFLNILFASIGIVQDKNPDDVNAYIVSLIVSLIGIVHLHMSTNYVARLDPILLIQTSDSITDDDLWKKQCIYDIRKIHVVGIYSVSIYSFFLFVTIQISLFTDPNRDAILPMFLSIPVLSLFMALSIIVHLYIWLSHSVVPNTDVRIGYSGLLLSLVSIVEFVSALAVGVCYIDGT